MNVPELPPSGTTLVWLDRGGHPATLRGALAGVAQPDAPAMVVVSSEVARDRQLFAPQLGIAVVQTEQALSLGTARNIGLAAASTDRVRFVQAVPDGSPRVIGESDRADVAAVGAFEEASTIADGRMRVFAMVTFRNEARHLPDYLTNVAAQVDGIVALDDGSSDGSGAIVAAHPAVREVLRLAPRQPHHWNGVMHRRLLVNAAARHGATWALALDADERIERGFRARAERIIEDAGPDGPLAYGVTLRELWDRPDQYRMDGVWAKKRIARFFRLRRDHDFGAGALHGHWAPENSRGAHGGFFLADLVIYHLKMIHATDRDRRLRRYQSLDPERQWQKAGYDYLTDATGLALERLPDGREYEPLRAEVPPTPDVARRPVVLGGKLRQVEI
ncbi:MAG: glycosyltransferase family 2 protein [Acidobacteria bacterium]|nr:glycosyltransferase family 2 protein [Acidobacteriota bacterium]